jgi:hypothetical protein
VDHLPRVRRQPLPAVLGRFYALRFRDAQNFRYSTDLGIVALRDEPASMTAYRVDGMNPGSDELLDMPLRAVGRSAAASSAFPLQMDIDLSEADKAKLAEGRRATWARPRGCRARNSRRGRSTG